MKAEYDRKYRAEHRDRLCQQKRDRYYANHEESLRKHAARRAATRAEPEAHAAEKAYKREYQSRPGWKEHKRQYDRRYRAEREFGQGPLAEAVVLLRELEEELRGPDRTARMNQRRHLRGVAQKQRRRGAADKKDKRRRKK